MTEQKPPQINPFIFPVSLLFFGLWFLYDGWISTDKAMQEHLLFNRVGSAILLPWAAYDFYKTWKSEKKYKARQKSEQTSSGS